MYLFYFIFYFGSFCLLTLLLLFAVDVEFYFLQITHKKLLKFIEPPPFILLVPPNTNEKFSQRFLENRVWKGTMTKPNNNNNNK